MDETMTGLSFRGGVAIAALLCLAAFWTAFFALPWPLKGCVAVLAVLAVVRRGHPEPVTVRGRR